jgi:predicted ATP-grasp superfamily ATP-dependent carboligase
MSDRAPAVVLKLAEDNLHYGSLGVARTLGRLGVPVFVVDEERHPVARWSRFVAESMAVDRSAPPDVLVEQLAALGRRLGDRPVLIPVDDLAVVLVERHAAALAESFRFQRQPKGLAERLLDKWELTALAREHDVPTPAAARPGHDGPAEELLRDATYPLVFKGARSYVGGRDRAGLLVVESREEALRELDALPEAERSNVIFQEYIPGGPDAIWMFNGYFDNASRSRLQFTGRKLRQWPPYTGATSLGISVPNETVAELTVRFMSAIGYRGVLDLGYRYDERDGRYKVLDVNPRVGATFRLFVDPRTGMDVVRALYLDLTGEAIPAPGPPAVRKWLVEDRDLRSSAAYRRDGRLGARAWLESLRGTDETAWFARDDPRPVGAAALRLGGGVLRRGGRRIRGER